MILAGLPKEQGRASPQVDCGHGLQSLRAAPHVSENGHAVRSYSYTTELEQLHAARSDRGRVLKRLHLTLRLLGFFGALGTTLPLLSQEAAREGREEVVLSGVVTDPTGALVQGAEVVLTPVQDGKGTAQAKQVTDALGRFRFRAASARYDLSVQAPGFAPFERRSVLLRAGVTEVAARLSVERFQQEIEVPEGQAGALDPNSSATALVFQGKSLDLLSNDDATLRQQLQALAGTTGTPTFLINGFSGGRLPTKASIRSIRINENEFSSAFAEFGAGRVEITTQPGGDTLHGFMQMSGTDQVLDARNPYTTLKPDFYDLQQQGTLSGPIGKKTSYFLADSFDQLANSAVVNAADPGRPEVQISTVAPAPETAQVYSLRLDRKFSEGNFGYLRNEWSLDQQTNSGIGPLILPQAAFGLQTLTNSFQAADTQILGARSVNETRFQYLRTRVEQRPNSTLPSVIVQGSFQAGGAPMQATADNRDAFEVQDLFETERGHHAFRFGARFRAVRDANRSTAGYNGQYIFPDAAAYRAKRATQYSQTVGRPDAVLSSSDLGIFAEDDWKVTPTFTLSYGLRFESQSAIPDHSDPAPRVGFAWAVQPGKRTTPIVTVRGGYGIFYDRFPVAQLLQSVRQDGTRQIAYLAQGTDFDPAGPPPGIVLGAGEPTIYQVNPRLKSNYTQYGGATVERALGHRGTVSAHFTYAHEAHLFLTRNLNAPLPGTTRPGVPGSGVRPFGDENLYAFSSDANGNLERVTLNFRLQPVSRVMMFGVFNTEKHFTEADGVERFPSNEYNLRQDYGRSNLNRAQWFTGGLQWSLPHGFQVMPFLDAHSGVPFDITTGNDENGDTVYNDRPGFGAGPDRPSVVQTPLGAFDTRPATGATLIPRNFGTSPAYFWLQLQASKDFHVGPRPRKGTTAAGNGAAQERPWDLNFAVEVHNLTNHNNPGPPVGVLSAQPCNGRGTATCTCATGQCPLVPSAFFGRSLSLASDFSPATASNRTILLQTSFSW